MGNEDWQLRMGDQLEAIAARRRSHLGVPFDPGAPPVGFEAIAHRRPADPAIDPAKPIKRLDETILGNPRNRAETKRA
jgi:hypothetical protein